MMDEIRLFRDRWVCREHGRPAEACLICAKPIAEMRETLRGLIDTALKNSHGPQI